MSTRLVATLMVRDVPEAASLLGDPPDGVDYVELRLDGLPAPDGEALASLLGAPRTVPVVVTCRSARQGGGFEGPEEERLGLLAEAVRAGADLVDVEDTALASMPEAQPDRWIASCHLARHMPRLEALGRRLAGHGTRFAKLAVPADTPRQLAALARVQDALPDHVAVVPTGRLAEAGRVLVAIRGTPLTYAALAADDPGHEDQPSLHRLHDLHHVGGLSPTTRLFAVLGEPVAHSLSPCFHDTVFRALGHNARLVPMAVDRVADVLARADELLLDGAAVTHPLKQQAVEEADLVLAGAALVGAANTIVRTPSGWQARNTDWRAAHELLPRLLAGWRRAAPGTPASSWVEGCLSRAWRGRREPRGEPASGRDPTVLVVGAGGAARAVVAALEGEDVEVLVWSRTAARGLALAETLRDVVAVRAVERLEGGPADLVVHATPVGLHGVDPSGLAVLDASLFRPGGVAVDLVYGAVDSPFRSAAGAAGVPVVGGELFFALQARRQAEAFVGQPVPPELADEAARRCGIEVRAPKSRSPRPP